VDLLYNSFYNKSGTSERASGNRHERVYNTSTARSQQFAQQIEAAEFERDWRDGTDNDVRYLGVFIESASCFKCSLDNAKRYFYRSFNGISGRVGRIASNEVIVQLVKSKCFPVLFYGLKACSLHKYQYKPVNYAINSTFRKIFNTRSQETVDVCLEIFGCLQAERTIAIRKRKFLNKFGVIRNTLCRVFAVIAKTELESCCTDV